MAYTCKEAIIGQLSAMGPTSIGNLRKECRTQVTDYNLNEFLRALTELQREGLVWREDCGEGIVYTNGC